MNTLLDVLRQKISTNLHDNIRYIQASETEEYDYLLSTSTLGMADQLTFHSLTKTTRDKLLESLNLGYDEEYDVFTWKSDHHTIPGVKTNNPEIFENDIKAIVNIVESNRSADDIVCEIIITPDKLQGLYNETTVELLQERITALYPVSNIFSWTETNAIHYLCQPKGLYIHLMYSDVTLDQLYHRIMDDVEGFAAVGHTSLNLSHTLIVKYLEKTTSEERDRFLRKFSYVVARNATIDRSCDTETNGLEVRINNDYPLTDNALLDCKIIWSEGEHDTPRRQALRASWEDLIPAAVVTLLERINPIIDELPNDTTGHIFSIHLNDDGITNWLVEAYEQNRLQHINDALKKHKVEILGKVYTYKEETTQFKIFYSPLMNL